MSGKRQRVNKISKNLFIIRFIDFSNPLSDFFLISISLK